MLFITPTTSAQAAKKYFSQALAHGDYYLRDAEEEMQGQWHGLGAELLGLSGDVSKADFFALCDNRNPVTGEQLTLRMKAKRLVYYDFTLDAPKAVTLAYEIGGDERVLDAFRASVQEVMGEMEADMHGRVRAGGANADRRTANMVWAEFVHRTTRPVDGVPDPQLHAHCCVFNSTYDTEEDRWKAAQYGNFVRDRLYYQAAFHSRLAERMQGLGYDVQRDKTSFTLDGIERATLRKFSRRSAVIEEAAARLGITDPKAKSELGRRTRERKQEGKSMQGLRSEWAARLTDAERLALAQARSGGNVAGPDLARQLRAKDAPEFAVAHCFGREAGSPEKRRVAEVLMEGVGKANVADVWAQAKRADVVRDVYREDLSMVAFARDGRGQHKKLGGAKPPELDPQLSSEQRVAALLLLNSRDTVTGLNGGVGTEKTRVMHATVKAIEAAGKEVFTFTPSANLSRGVLRSKGFASGDTVERLLTDTGLRRAVRGQVLWINEAGLLSTRDMRRVFDLAKEERCRVILSGDSARSDALSLLERDAGIKFARLKGIRHQTNEQYREALREISSGDARDGNRRTLLEAGIERLDRMGAIVEAGGDARHKLLAADYVTATAERKRDGSRKTALVVSPTHWESDLVATSIRDELKCAGRLAGKERMFLSLEPLGLTEAERGNAASYRGGEIVRFDQNAKGFTRGERVTVVAATGGGVTVTHADGRTAALPLTEVGKFEVYQARQLLLAAGDCIRVTQNGFTRKTMRAGKLVKNRLNNGDVFHVASFTRDGDIRLANGFVVPKGYGGIEQGYAVVTSQASQGATLDKVLIALGAESLSEANRQQFYGSVARCRQAVCLYTDDKAALRDALKADASRLSATELLHGKGKKPTAPDSSARLFSMQRNRRAYEAVRDRAAQASWQQASARKEVRHGRH